MDTTLSKPIQSKEIADALGLRLVGDSTLVSAVATLELAGRGSLCFSKKAIEQFTPQATVIASSAPDGTPPNGSSILLSGNARLDFARALNWLHLNVGFARDTSPPCIHPTATIGKWCVIGPGVSIGENTKVGNHVTILAGASIGANCVIKSGAVIGEDGFGFERGEGGIPVRMPHLGSVKIGNEVEIGSVTTVCRGTLLNTIIEDYVKIDDHVHIAHNVLVRRGAMIIACAEISGGVEIGEFAWFGPNASIIQKRKVGKGALVGIAANVLKDVEENGVVVGNPAKPLNREP